MTEVNRHISYYDRYNDKYIGKIPLNNVGLNDLLPLDFSLFIRLVIKSFK